MKTTATGHTFSLHNLPSLLKLTAEQVPGIPGTFSSAVMLMAHIKSLAPLSEFMT